MGNTCFKKHVIKEPNQPVTVVHLSTGGKVLAVSAQLNTTHPRSSNSVHIIRKENVSSNSLIIKANNIRNHENERRRSPLRPRNPVSSNTLIGAAKHNEDKRHGKPIDTRDWTVKKADKKDEEQPRPHAYYKVRCFFYDVLRDATNNFSKKNLIGEGGFGDVYKGYLTHCIMNAAKPNEGFPVAIKTLVPQRYQGCEAWHTEVKILSRLNHPNIVKLKGCCNEGNHRMLIYEYMEKGSLDSRLFTENRKELNWGRRISIAAGAARGLAYIHTYETPIIHRDIKASNILIDSKFTAKISDFGLAKFGPEDENDHLSTKVFGTKGYFAPEYFRTGHLTVKADVYSFGVVLLEILTGSCVDNRCTKGVRGNLVDRVKPLLCGSNLELHRIIDEKLGKNIPMEEAQRFALLTYQCLSEEPRRRPTMTEVVTSLEQLQQIVSGAYIYHDALTVAGFSACPPPSSKMSSRGKACK